MKIASILVLFVVATGAHAEMFRWVDTDGKIHYSDTPPPANAKKVEEKKFGGNTAIATENLPYSLQLAVKSFPVTLYSGDCGDPCKQGQAYLAKRGIPYSQRLPGNNAEDAKAFKQVSSENMIPVLVVGKVYTLKGFNENEWANALDQAGYPKSNTFPGGKSPAPATTKSNTVPAAPATPAGATPSGSTTPAAPAEGARKGY